MRATVKKLLWGLALGAALSGPAAAEEQLVMPFACHVAGGQVSLAPSAPQTYQIYGRREHKRLTTCSPYDPQKCHNWSVHRFDLDCGGVRTSWQSVVAALAPILAESVHPTGDAYADLYDQGRAGPYRPGAGPAVAFPRGFAPNPMKVARFQGSAPAPVPANVPLPPRKPEIAPPPQVAENAPENGPDLALPAAPSAPSDKAQAAKTALAAPKTTEVAEHRALKIEIESGSGEVTGALPKAGAASGTPWRNPSMVFTLTLAVLFALSATLLLGRRRMLALPLPWPRARLQGPDTLPSLARASNAGLDEAPAEPGEVPANRLRLWDEAWLPATVNEALDVLGVEPDAGSEKIKRTVTRLRRALHPDHALDEEDRLLRERRLKQINVAWEIVSGKRRSLWLSAKPRSS